MTHYTEATILRAQGPWFLVPGTDISKPSGSQNFNGSRQALRYREKCQRRRDPLFGGRVFSKTPWKLLLGIPVEGSYCSIFHVLLDRASKDPTLIGRV